MMLAALALVAAAAPLAAGKSAAGKSAAGKSAAEMVADAQPGFGLRTSACVFKCESGYHAALNKTSLRGTAARLAAAAGDETKFDGFRIMNRRETADPSVDGMAGGAPWDFRSCAGELQRCYATCHHGRKKITERLEGKQRCDGAFRQCARAECAEAAPRGTASEMCEGDVGIAMATLGSNACVAYLGSQIEACKCVETRYKGAKAKDKAGPKQPKPEFNSLDEACAAVAQEAADSDDATWLPIGALISASVFSEMGMRMGYMGPAARLGPGEKVRVEALPGLKTVWEDYDEWDDDYAWQADSEGATQPPSCANANPNPARAKCNPACLGGAERAACGRCGAGGGPRRRHGAGELRGRG